jgi:hypothetical protein
VACEEEVNKMIKRNVSKLVDEFGSDQADWGVWY